MNFWDEWLEGVKEEDPVAAPKGEAGPVAAPKGEAGPVAAPKGEAGGGGPGDGPEAPRDGPAAVLHVPPESAEEIQRKAGRIAEVTGASLELVSSVLRVRGSQEQQQQAERYANAVLFRSLSHEEHPDVTMIPVLADWIDSWRGKEARIESAHGVLIVFEAPRKSDGIKYSTGQTVEAIRDATSEERSLAVVMAKALHSRLLLRWCADGVSEEVPLSRVRPAPRLGVFGEAGARTRAELAAMVAFEAAARGSMAAHLENAKPAEDGVGLEWAYLDLLTRRRGERMKQMEEEFELPELLPRATGCLSVCFFEFPKWSPGQDNARICVVVLGEREQRSLALGTLHLFAPSLERRYSDSMPREIASGGCTINVPYTMRDDSRRSAIEDSVKYYVNMKTLMTSTNTIISALKATKAPTFSKSLDHEGDAMSATFWSLRHGPQVRLAVVGQPRAQMSARIKVMAQVEERHEGFHERPADAGQQALQVKPDASEGLAVDLVWLQDAFECRTSRQLGQILAAASGCLVESSGSLVFLAGELQERRRAQEYLSCMTAPRLRKVLELDEILLPRDDLIQLRVPSPITKSSWIFDNLEALSLEVRVVTIFDQWQGPGRWSRLSLLGSVLQEGGADLRESLRQRAVGLVEEAAKWTKKDNKEEIRLLGQWWRLDGSGDRAYEEEAQRAAQEKAAQEEEARRAQRESERKAWEEARLLDEKKAKEAADRKAAEDEKMRLVLAAAPRTPGASAPTSPSQPNRSDTAVPAPSTPAPAGSVAAPQTPAAPGAAVAAPRTPAGPAGAVAAPTTPAGPVLAAPQTPAGPGLVAAPKTPVAPKSFKGAAPPRFAAVKGGAASVFKDEGPSGQQSQDARPRAKRARGAPPPAHAKIGALSVAEPLAVPRRATPAANAPARREVAAAADAAPEGESAPVVEQPAAEERAPAAKRRQSAPPPKLAAVGSTVAAPAAEPRLPERASRATAEPAEGAAAEEASDGGEMEADPTRTDPDPPAAAGKLRAGAPPPSSAVASGSGDAAGAPKANAKRTRAQGPPPASARVHGAEPEQPPVPTTAGVAQTPTLPRTPAAARTPGNAAGTPAGLPRTPAAARTPAARTPAARTPGAVAGTPALPRTPTAAGVAPPRTPADALSAAGVAASRTPATIAARTPAGVVPPCTPAAALRAAKGAPPPAAARVAEGADLDPSRIVPMTPARPGAGAPQTPGLPAAAPRTPGVGAGAAAPQTPAAIRGSGGALSRAAPQTPAAITGRAGAAPQTPAAFSGLASSAEVGAPQTPAFAGSQSSAAAAATPMPSGTATPALISTRGAPVPATPAAGLGLIGLSGRATAPGTPAAILQSAPPSPAEVPAQGAAKEPARPKRSQGSDAPSNWAPKRRRPASGKEVKAEQEEEDYQVAIHPDMTYAQWAEAKLRLQQMGEGEA